MNCPPRLIFASVGWILPVLVAWMAPLHADDVKETFINISEGALVTTLPQWTHSGNEEDNWTLTNLGADGGVIEASSKGAYHRKLTDREEVKDGSEPRTFRFKIRFTGPDAWAAVQIDLLEAGGINGCGIRFDGGEAEGSADNRIGVSQGGTFWGNPQYHWLEARWQSNIWYQVEITNLAVTSQGVTGVVNIFNISTPGEKLVENQALGSFGSVGSFKALNIIAISSSGAARPFQVGNIELVAAKGTANP